MRWQERFPTLEFARGILVWGAALVLSALPPADGQTGWLRGMAEAGQPRGGGTRGRRQGERQQLVGVEGRREAWGREGTCSL